MTMLDRMRRHRNWLKWSLGLVCLAFVIFYIPDFLQRPPATGAASATRSPSSRATRSAADEFRRTYQAQLQAYRTAYGGNMSEQLLKQLGVEQQILQQMVDERAALAEAERLGITVERRGSARSASSSIPAFQENGAFIGEAALPAAARHAASADDAARVRGQRPRARCVVDKLRPSLTEWLSVTDKELEQEYRRRNDKVKLAVVSVPDRQLPARRDRDRRRGRRPLRGAQGRLHGSPRSGRSATCSSTSTRSARRSSCRRPTSSAPTTTTSSSTRRPSRCAPATSC